MVYRIREEAFAVRDKGHGFAAERYVYHHMYVYAVSSKLMSLCSQYLTVAGLLLN